VIINKIKYHIDVKEHCKGFTEITVEKEMNLLFQIVIFLDPV